MMNDPLFLLKKYWHHGAFRPLQEEIIAAVLSGKDTLALLPTGAGKSICYQVPALSKDGFCLVVSPLIALMQDQVLGLREKGIPAAFLHSGMNRKQLFKTLDNALHLDYKVLYVSPERIQTEGFQQFAENFNLNLIAVDEAHCISQWGHDFRPAYRKIKDLKTFFPDTPVLALTATANKKVQEDISEQLELQSPEVFRQSVVRKNLFYQVHYTENKRGDLGLLFNKVKGSGILYSRSRRKSVDLAVQLNAEGIATSVYHAGMTKEERDAAQQRWQNSGNRIMSATTAFGMGIDKPDVRLVAHSDVPDSLEEYYQEAGRAGRDGKEAHAVLLYNPPDISRLNNAVEVHYPAVDYIRKVYQNAGDFLQLPLGEGREGLYPFDIMRFVRNFKLETLSAISAIRIIEQEGHWQWNENTQTRSIVQFTTNKTQLAYLAKDQPRLSAITIGLLRLHGSIFNFPTPLDIFETAKLLRMEQPALHKGLTTLADLGIIDYQPALNGSTLFWLGDRVKSNHLPLDKKRIARLRKIYEERVRAMTDYLQTDDICRNILLADYFGEHITEDCGRCDACKKKAEASLQPSKIKAQIMELLQSEKEISVEALNGYFPAEANDWVIRVLRELSDEGHCSISLTGLIKKE